MKIELNIEAPKFRRTKNAVAAAKAKTAALRESLAIRKIAKAKARVADLEKRYAERR